MGLQKNLKLAEIKGINYIKPNFNGKTMIAKSNDYVCIMHFDQILKVHGNNIKEEYIDEAFKDYQFNNFKRNNRF